MEVRIDEQGWHERYGCYSKMFGRAARLSFAHEKGGYQMRINDDYLKNKRESVKDAKIYVLKTAIQWFEKSLAEMKKNLEEIEKG